MQHESPERFDNPEKIKELFAGYEG